MDGSAAFAVRRMKQQAALLQINRAVRLVERKNCVSSHARDCVVVSHQFRARCGAGADQIRHFEKAVYNGRLEGFVLGGNNFHIVDDLRELGLLQING